jgi:hypothetical protein
MVSGREDFGFEIYTTTILCEGCEELYDVVTARFPPNPFEEGFKQSEPVCPKNREHSVRRWEYPDLCPRCGEDMIMGDKLTLWD